MLQAILDEIIMHAVKQRKNEKIDLLTNAKAKEIVIEQGKIQGQSKLISYLSQEFTDISVMVIARAFEDADDEQTDVTKLTGEDLAALDASMGDLRLSEGWQRVMDQITGKTEEIKDNLLKTVNKSRTLYFLQGIYQGMVCYQEVFDAVETEVQHRKEERERLEQERASSLPFDENDGVNMVPSKKDEPAEEEPLEEDDSLEEDESGETEEEAEDIPGFDVHEEAVS